MTADETDSGSPYVFDRSEGEEERRLEAQARIIDPLTERLFRAAGLGAGMRVLELGSGGGDVSLLAARIVGPRGAVVGVEFSTAAIETARRRVEQAGLGNVTFVEGDINELAALGNPQGPSLDAVVGRFILQFLPQPAAVLRAAAERVRPGGLVCFQEGDNGYTWAYPPSPLWDKAREWYLRALEGTHVEQRMGLRLYAAFLAAGLPAPELRLEAAIGGGERAPASVWAGVVRAVVPVLERLAIATAAEVDAATLGERLLADAVAQNRVVVATPLIGAWARTPATETAGRS